MAKRMAMRRRRKKRFQWLGSRFANQFNLQNDETVAFEIVSPQLETAIGANVDCVLERVILGYNIQNTNVLVTGRVDMYLAVLETTLALAPLAYIPDIDDSDFFEKRDTMWWMSHLVGLEGDPSSWVGTTPSVSPDTGVLVNNGNPYDIGVKRRVRGKEAVYLVVRFHPDPDGESAPTGVLNAWARILFSYGRR